jgi:hypothetical protein
MFCISSAKKENKMDRVTESYLKIFGELYELPIKIDQSVLFEHFVNYSIMDPFIDNTLELDEVNIGKNGTIGLDGFAIIINQKIFYDEANLDSFLKTNSDLSVSLIFVQAKTSSSFQTKELNSFGYAVNDFLTTCPSLAWPSHAKEKIKLVNRLLEDIAKFREKPNCFLYYVTLGRYQEDPNISSVEKSIKENLGSLNIFSNIKIQLIDANGIHARYKKIGQAITKTLEISNSLELPEIQGIKESYLCFVKALSIVELISNDDGELIQNVFNDNVRDYQGENTVNRQIKLSLEGINKDAFVILNNGITIICEGIETLRNKFTLTNFQIINGCQTSHVLFLNKDLLTEDVFLTVKIICTESVELTSKIIWSTNNQTEIKEQDLLAATHYQRLLEEYYHHIDPDRRLYYERRSKQYNSKGIPKTRIVDKMIQIKCIGSFYFDQPDNATRYFGSLYQELGSKIFQDDHKPEIYYVSTYSLFKIEELFRMKIFESKYKKIKYFILMMFKFEIAGRKLSQLNSKEIVKESEDFLKILHDQRAFEEVIKKVLAKIDSLGVDISSVELSKSNQFARQCKEIYTNTKCV